MRTFYVGSEAPAPVVFEADHTSIRRDIQQEPDSDDLPEGQHVWSFAEERLSQREWQERQYSDQVAITEALALMIGGGL